MLTDYKFNGKEKDEETGLYYYGARYYSPELSVWLSVDAMADKRPNLSPYNYCQLNPVILTDPTGMLDDGYTVNEKGYLQWKDKTGGKNYDVIYSNDDNGNAILDESKALKIDKNVIASKKTNTGLGTDGKKYTFDLFTVKGDEKAKDFFEFLSKNTKGAEWSQTLIGLEKFQKSIISTSHDKDTEAGQGYLFENGYTIRGHNHSHPYDNIPSVSDKNWAESVHNKFGNKVPLNIYYKGNYTGYDKFGILPQFIKTN